MDQFLDDHLVENMAPHMTEYQDKKLDPKISDILKLDLRTFEKNSDPFAWPTKQEPTTTQTSLSLPGIGVKRTTHGETSMYGTNSQSIDELLRTFSSSSTVTTSISPTSTSKNLTETPETTYAPKVTKLFTDFHTTIKSEDESSPITGLEVSTGSGFDLSTSKLGMVEEISANVTETPMVFENTTITEYLDVQSRSPTELSTNNQTLFESTVTDNTLTNLTTTSLDIVSDKPTTFGLNTAVNISDIKMPTFKTEFEPETVTSSIQQMLDSMKEQTKKPDPAIFEPISPNIPSTGAPGILRSYVSSEEPLFNSLTTESPLDLINGTVKKLVLKTTDTPTINSTSSVTTNASHLTTIQDKITTVTSKTITNMVDQITTTTTASPDITTAVEYEITTVANELTTVANDFTSVSNINNITSIATDTTTTIINDYTTTLVPTEELTTKVSEILKNTAFGKEQSESAETNNTWVFYVIVAVTITILFLVIGGVFLFYKKIKKNGKASGYQVSQMREYSSSGTTDSDVINVKV